MTLARELAPEYLELPPDQQDIVRRSASRLMPISTPIADPVEEYDKSIEGRGKAIDRARAAGFAIIEGTPHTLLIDLDGDKPLNRECLKMLCDLVGEVPTTTHWQSKSGGTHVLFHFEKTTFTEAEAVAIEAALGSDQKRAVLCILRLKNSVPWPRVLFKPAEKGLAGQLFDLVLSGVGNPADSSLSAGVVSIITSHFYGVGVTV